ncbi:hypothetical protein CYY_002971 [Polysphondylium violaceum]|uniref:TLDc domain-containing protein n=1 Tax=Polysphondylium violaceum TaxID=133409 RepID=A0A8J4PXC6_9MYCE|nr:hypothetical protein CYY_002971 [Polysphondylium violaceum]
METNSNFIIDDNARLQQENWEFKKAGCSNKDHISLILQIEKKDKKLEKYARIIDQLKIENKNSLQESNNRIDSILKLYSGKTNEIDQFKQEINKLFSDKFGTLAEENNRLKSDFDKNNHTMNDLQSLYCSLLKEHGKLKSKLETQATSFNQELKSLESNNNKIKKEIESLETKHALLISNHDEKEKEIQELKEKLNASEYKISLKNIVLESKIIDYISFKTINDWITSGNYSFKIIYRASNNGFSTQSFHSACDGKGPTITVIKTTDGCVFGGYNSQSWNSDRERYGDDKCFIFTLVNKHGIKPTKYFPPNNMTKYLLGGPQTTYVIGVPSFGPCFGSGDIKVRGSNGTQSFPDSYRDTTGKGESTLTPSKKFMIQDYEVYQCLVD